MPFQIQSGVPRSGGGRALRGSVLALSLGVALVACGGQDQAGAPAGPTSAPTPARSPAAVSSRVAAMGADQLRAAAAKALTEQRLYAPAGDNAMEYYVALRDKVTNDASVASALTDLMPYTLIATEQSIAREDFAEAQRLYALMQKADPEAPALPRLKQGIADGQTTVAERTAVATARNDKQAKRQQASEKQRVTEQEAVPQAATQQTAMERAAAKQASRQAAENASPDAQTHPGTPPSRPIEEPARAQPQPAPGDTAAVPSTVSAPPPPAPASTMLRALSTPSPAYPPEALRAGEGGEVVVEFTVNPDGSVSNARVVRSNPPRIFDRAVLSVVRRWRFQPVAAAITTRRTIGFNPGD